MSNTRTATTIDPENCFERYDVNTDIDSTVTEASDPDKLEFLKGDLPDKEAVSSLKLPGLPAHYSALPDGIIGDSHSLPDQPDRQIEVLSPETERKIKLFGVVGAKNKIKSDKKIKNLHDKNNKKCTPRASSFGSPRKEETLNDNDVEPHITTLGMKHRLEPDSAISGGPAAPKIWSIRTNEEILNPTPIEHDMKIKLEDNLNMKSADMVVSNDNLSLFTLKSLLLNKL